MQQRQKTSSTSEGCVPKAWSAGGVFFTWDSFLECSTNEYTKKWSVRFRMPSPFFRGGQTRVVNANVIEKGKKIEYTSKVFLFHFVDCGYEEAAGACNCKCSKAARLCKIEQESLFPKNLSGGILGRICEYISPFGEQAERAFQKKKTELEAEGKRLEDVANRIQVIISDYPVDNNYIINLVQSQYPGAMGPITITPGQWVKSRGQGSTCEKIQISSENAGESVSFEKILQRGSRIDDGPSICGSAYTRSVGLSNL